MEENVHISIKIELLHRYKEFGFCSILYHFLSEDTRPSQLCRKTETSYSDILKYSNLLANISASEHL